METPYISAEEAAQMLGKTRRRINQLVAEGKLQGERIGNSNVILKTSVIAVKNGNRSSNRAARRATKAT